MTSLNWYALGFVSGVLALLALIWLSDLWPREHWPEDDEEEERHVWPGE